MDIEKLPYQWSYEKYIKTGYEIIPRTTEQKLEELNRAGVSEKAPQKSDKANKYQVECKGIFIDVYDVLVAFGVTNPADQHAIKKMLMPGKRGVKDGIQDREEAISSLKRAIEIERGLKN